MSWAVGVLIFVTLQRLAELVLAQRNTARLLARGGTERSPEHYKYIVLLHAAWLAGLWYLAWDASVNFFWLSLFVALQCLRVWVLATLGDRWTTRIIIVPGEPRVTTGPFRFLNHPNYAVVVAEIAVLPLAFGLFYFALLFSMLNAAILVVRIRAESQALEEADHREAHASTSQA